MCCLPVVRVIPLGQEAGSSAATGLTEAALAAALKCPAPEVVSDAEVDALILQNIPESIFGRLYPFQREGVRFGVKHQGRGLLADEMGLGKTVQVCTYAAPYSDAIPVKPKRQSLAMTALQKLSTTPDLSAKVVYQL